MKIEDEPMDCHFGLQETDDPYKTIGRIGGMLTSDPGFWLHIVNFH